MSCGVRPSERARSWSTSSRIDFFCSFQSNCTSRVLGLARMAARTLSATARTLSLSGPITRNCTGKPTGGPKFSRSMRRRASGITFCATSPSSRAFSRSRASASLVIITMSAKLSFGSTGFKARKKRGEPSPI